MAVLAVTLPVLLGLRNFDVDLHLKASDLTTATMLAQEKLLEAELLEPLAPGEVGGDFQGNTLGLQHAWENKDQVLGHRWKRIISPAPLERIHEIRVQVMWLRGTNEEMLEVSTYVFQPPLL